VKLITGSVLLGQQDGGHGAIRFGDDPDASAIPKFVGREHPHIVAHGAQVPQLVLDRVGTFVYWITWSARRRRDGGIVRPRALAVLRLIASSNFVGCSTGRSAGFAPLRILST